MGKILKCENVKIFLQTMSFKILDNTDLIFRVDVICREMLLIDLMKP